MKIAIIGAGNMGTAIASGLLKSGDRDIEVCISNPDTTNLKKLKSEFPQIETTTQNYVAIKNADFVIFAVKPWVLPVVAEELKNEILPSTIVSIAAGVGLDNLEKMFGSDHAIFYVIPNTAIMVGRGMTFVTSRNAENIQVNNVLNIFGKLGSVALIDEKQIPAATALCSCGIAYAFKYIQACIQAGIQMGFRPDEAKEYAVATVMGAMTMLEQENLTPQQEIDRVTTPGGMTIKGINKLEETGFVNSVIKSIIEPVK